MPRSPARVFLGLGSNLGDRPASLRAALEGLRRSGLAPLRVSSVFESEPIGPVGEQPPYLNAVVLVESELEPRPMLGLLQRMERELGRQPGVPKGPRLIDLDLLLYAQMVRAWPELVVPHPEIARRAFVLRPLLELEPGLVDPRSGRPFSEALELVREQRVEKIGSIA